MDERYVFLDFQIDTNRINVKQKLGNMNKLEAWHNNGVIQLEVSKVAQAEASAGKNIERTRKASQYIYSETWASTLAEQEILATIADVLFPAGPTSTSQKNDIEIVFNAWKYKCILITNDGGSNRQPGGILGNREKLGQLGIQIMSDSEAVARVKQAIIERDKRVTRHFKGKGALIPSWVGSD